MPIEDFSKIRNGTVIRLNGRIHSADPTATPHDILAKIIENTGTSNFICLIGGQKENVGYGALRFGADVVKQGRPFTAQRVDLDD